MMIFTILSVICACTMCIHISITDIKNNIISNRTLAIYGMLAVFLDITQLLLKIEVLWELYFLNLLVTAVLAIILYVIKVWAAGDSKALIVLAGLLPAELGMMNDRITLCGVMIIGISFGASFVYLIGESLWLLIIKKRSISKTDIKKKLKLFAGAFVRNIIYLSLVLKIEMYHTGEWFSRHPFAVVGINICIILVISSFKIFRNKWLLATIFAISMLLAVLLQEWFLDERRIKYYILLVGIMIIRAVISEYNYDIIPTDKVEKGMILSTFTTMMMLNSSIQGLPEISREDMCSRLSEDEAAAVIRWGKSKKGAKEVQIVRKTPYAIFICLGLFFYIAGWGLMAWF